tara:strand:- start:2922 stop:3344 length:423 start_codon:yes stop_codon:yes gene_type:complete
MIKVIEASHVDHGLTSKQLDFVLAQIGEVAGFGIHRVVLPESLGTVPCGLYGPTMGDDPVLESEVRLKRRGDREGLSRMVDRPVRQVSTVTVIAGPHEGETVLYTAFGGPPAPREPWDSSLDENGVAESLKFWSEHALAI